MRVARAILALSLGAVALAAGATLLRPRPVRVERSAVVALPVCNVAGLLDGARHLHRWSPWPAPDPDLRGPARGAGASAVWAGGAWRVTSVSGCEQIAGVLAQAGVAHRTGFQLAPQGDDTRITWWIEAPAPREAERALDAGLARLAAGAADVPRAEFTGLAVDRVAVPPVESALLAVDALGPDPSDALAGALGRLDAAILAMGLTRAGPPRADFTPSGDGWAILASIPVTGAPTGASPDPGIRLGHTPPLDALRTVHVGPAEGIDRTWERLRSWAFFQGLRHDVAGFVERYVDDPASTPAAQVRTELYLPL